MTSLRVQHCFQGPSGEAKDTYCNTFHMTTPDGAPATGLYTGISTAIKAFYTHLTAPTNSMMSTVVNNAGASVKIYDLADPPIRIAVHEEFYTPAFTSGGSFNMPNEVAICLSYNAEPQAGAVRARNRGRIYLGPLNVNALGTVTAGTEPVVSSTLRTAILSAGNTLYSALFSLNAIWSIYSAATFAAGVTGDNHDLAMFPIFDLTVDNAFDTQRRRGTLPSAKTVAAT
jgi:hypothetical protein